MDFNEKEIVESILKGDVELFSKIVDKFKDPIFVFLYRLSLNEALAEELLQQTFLKVYKYLESADTEKGLKNWMYMIARNTFIDYIKKENRIKSVSMEDFQFFLASKTATPEKQAIKNSQIDEIMEAIYSLSVKYSEIMILRYVEEKSYEEISEILQIPLGTVKIRLHRAKEKLREMLLCSIGEIDELP